MVPVFIISFATVIKNLSKQFIKKIDFVRTKERITIHAINSKMIRDENELF
jgi:hypothetical protein